MELNKYADLTGKGCDKQKVLIGRKLADLIKSVDGLWEDIARLARTDSYIQTDEFYYRVSLELQVIEAKIGETDGVKELKSLIAPSVLRPAHRGASPVVASR